MITPPKKKALLFVHNKDGIAPFARNLMQFNYHIYSSGDTLMHLREKNISVSEIGKIVMRDFHLAYINVCPIALETKQSHATVGSVTEKIDIKKISLLRSAARNFQRIIVLCDDIECSWVLRDLHEDGDISDSLRLNLAIKAFTITAMYDLTISQFLRTQIT